MPQEFSTENSGKSFSYPLGFFLLSTAFFLALFALTPMSSDDVNFWTLRLTDFADILAFSLPYGNGRLLGNIGVFYLVEYRLLRVLVKALVLSAIVVWLPCVLGLKSKTSYWGSLFLLLGVSPHIFAQTYSWTSGFQNYVPTLFLFLLGLLLVEAAEKKPLALQLPLGAAAFLCGVSMQLYVEHSSCVHLLFLFCLLAYEAKGRRRLSPVLLSLFAGALLGGAIMFFLPRYFCPDGGWVSGYRGTVFENGLAGLVLGTVKNGIKLLGMFSENTLVLGSLAALQLILVLKNRSLFPKSFSLVLGCLAVPSLLLLGYHQVGLRFWYGKLAVAESVLLAAAVLVLLAALLLSGVKILLSVKKKRLFLAYTMLVFSVISIVPLAFVEPIWPRCLLHAYVFLMAAVLLLLEELLLTHRVLIHRWLRRSVAALTLTAMLSLLVLFADLNRMHDIREDTMARQAAAGQTELDYFALPSDYMYDYWLPDYYAAYYSLKLQKPVELNILPPDVWLNTHYY